jgi:hypothetical protein
MRAWWLMVGVALAVVPAHAAEPIGVITELNVAGGAVEVRPASGGDWQPAKPLLSINEGDQVRAAGGGRAVLVFVGAPRSVVVTVANSPLVAAAPAQPGLGERLGAAIGWLQSTPREPSRKALTVRSSRDFSSVVQLSPRDTLVAAEGVRLEWQGPEDARYTVRVIAGDSRVLWSTKNVDARALALPADVRLAPGRYRWELESPAFGIQRAAFDVASAEAVAQARAGVAAVDPARHPPATAALLRAATLARGRFHADARRQLLEAIAASPEEPALHVLLADVYDRMGLDSLAAAEYDRAEALSVGR